MRFGKWLVVAVLTLMHCIALTWTEASAQTAYPLPAYPDPVAVPTYGILPEYPLPLYPAPAPAPAPALAPTYTILPAYPEPAPTYVAQPLPAYPAPAPAPTYTTLPAYPVPAPTYVTQPLPTSVPLPTYNPGPIAPAPTYTILPAYPVPAPTLLPAPAPIPAPTFAQPVMPAPAPTFFPPPMPTAIPVPTFFPPIMPSPTPVATFAPPVTPTPSPTYIAAPATPQPSPTQKPTATPPPWHPGPTFPPPVPPKYESCQLLFFTKDPMSPKATAWSNATDEAVRDYEVLYNKLFCNKDEAQQKLCKDFEDFLRPETPNPAAYKLGDPTIILRKLKDDQGHYRKILAFEGETTVGADGKHVVNPAWLAALKATLARECKLRPLVPIPLPGAPSPNDPSKPAAPVCKVKFYSATWCAPCKQFAPIVSAAVAGKYDYKLLKCNTDDKAECNALGIRAYPEVRATKDGTLFFKRVGAFDVKQLLDSLKKNCPVDGNASLEPDAGGDLVADAFALQDAYDPATICFAEEEPLMTDESLSAGNDY